MDTNNKDKVLAKDLAAYQRLRRDGVQPRGIDGAAEAEKNAESRFEIESGNLLPKDVYGKGIEARVKQGMAEVQALNEAS